jgi:hypothetical protein
VLRIKTDIVENDLSMALELIRTSIFENIQNQITSSPFIGEGRGGGV